MHWQQSSPLALELRSRLPQHPSALLPPSFCSALPPTSPLSGKPCLFTLLPNNVSVLVLYCTKHDLLHQFAILSCAAFRNSFWPCVCTLSWHAFRPEVSCSGCKTALCLLLVFHGNFFCCNRMHPSLRKSQIKLHALEAVHLAALCAGDSPGRSPLPMVSGVQRLRTGMGAWPWLALLCSLLWRP